MKTYESQCQHPGRFIAAFDATYLLQISTQFHDKKNDKVNLLGGAWRPLKDQNCSVEVVEDLEIANITPATDMFLVSAQIQNLDHYPSMMTAI